MSLNRCEQQVFDYLRKHREEGEFWTEKVRSAAKRLGAGSAAVEWLARELSDYHRERSGVVPAFREEAGWGGTGRISMKNLAELLIRLWVEPKPKNQQPGAKM